MHAPTCPVKMAGTLQRPCANCARTIFGVWFFTVKARAAAGDAREPGHHARGAVEAQRRRFMRYADSLAL
jgi:hypothetical protein